MRRSNTHTTHLNPAISTCSTELLMKVDFFWSVLGSFHMKNIGKMIKMQKYMNVFVNYCEYLSFYQLTQTLLLFCSLPFTETFLNNSKKSFEHIKWKCHKKFCNFFWWVVLSVKVQNLLFYVTLTSSTDNL